MDGKIHIKSFQIEPRTSNVVKLSPDAMDVLVHAANQSGRCIKDVASEIIIQAAEKDLIVFDWRESKWK